MLAPRYAENADPALVAFITDELPYLSFDEACDFYSAAIPTMREHEIALLGCNDRFFLLTGLLDRQDAVNSWYYDRSREVEAEPDGYLDLWARWHGKMLPLELPVPTPSGWRLHGDLRPGHKVFGPDGQPTTVIANTPVWENGDCYRISFDRGYSLVAGGDHLWTVQIQSRKRTLTGREGRKTVTVNSRELKKLVERATEKTTITLPGIPVCDPLLFPERDLPVDPYVLGVWLGDGTTGHPYITSGLSDVDEMQQLLEATGIEVRRRTHTNAATLCLGNGRRGDRTSSAIANKLRAIGVYRDKHVPTAYLTASPAQRQALLQGLMDTDGTCEPRKGTATFSNASEKLARCVFDLAAGLGLKPGMRAKDSVYGGEPYRSWDVSFQARADFPVFRLARKQSRSTKKSKPSSFLHRVISVEPVESTPCSCIQVDRPDGLYVVGEHYIATHNSSIITHAGVIQEILIDPEITIGIFSNSLEIARPFLAQIVETLEANEYLKQIYPDVLWQHPRKEAPTWSKADGIVVKRKGNTKERTVEAHGLIDALPTGRHFQLRVYDDVVTEKSIGTPEQIIKTTTRWELSDNLGVGPGSRIWHAGTRYHYGDTYGVLLERGVLKARIYPATTDGTLKGEPILMSQDEWDALKMKQRSTVAAQMLLNPLAGEENTFLIDWLRPYELRPSLLNVYIIGDPSMGKSKTSDRTAIAVVGIDGRGNRFLLDGYCHRMRLSDRWKSLKDLYLKWKKAPGVQMVRVGWERYGLQADVEYFDDRALLEKVDIAIDEVNWVREGPQSKQARVGRLEPYFRNSKFWMPPTVWIHGAAHTWSVDADHGIINYTPKKGETREERRARTNGEVYRIVDPIRRMDEDGNAYDLFRMFAEEFQFFPFAPHDDLVDAVSRVEDLEPVPPQVFERIKTEIGEYDDA